MSEGRSKWKNEGVEWGRKPGFVPGSITLAG